MAVVYRDYLTTKDLPNNVEELVDLMRVSPSTAEDVTLPSEPLVSDSLHPSQLESIMREVCHTNDVEDVQFETQSILDFVLSASLGLKEISLVDDDLGPRHTTPVWYSLLSMLGNTAFAKSVTLADVAFVKPKGFNSEQAIASVLVSYVADKTILSHLMVDEQLAEQSVLGEEVPGRFKLPSERHDDSDQYESSASQGNEDGSEYKDDYEDGSEYEDNYDEESEYNPLDDMDSVERYNYMLDNHPIYTAEHVVARRGFDDAELFFGPDVSDEEPSDSDEWLDVPPDAHILAGHRLRPAVLLPVICVAEGGNIVALVTSCVYQRHAWGIDLPVVGLQMSQFGSKVHVHIGWMDDGKTVHIARPALEPSKSLALDQESIGIFDLACTLQVIQFSCLLLSLGRQFRMLADSLRSHRASKIGWRADDNKAVWTSSITGWLHSVGTSDNGSISDSSSELAPATPQIPVGSDDVATEQSVALAKPRQSPSIGTQSTASSVTGGDSAIQKIGGRESPLLGRTSQSGVKVSTRSLRKSCSEFARLEEKGIDNKDESSTMNWLVHRHTFPIACTKVALDENHPILVLASADPPELDKMMDIYHDLTSLKWIKEWSKVDALPKMPGRLEEYRTGLFAEYQELAGNLDSNASPGFLEDTLASILRDKFYDLLGSVNGACMRKQALTNTLEAESRHNWDNLLYDFYVGGGENRSQQVMLERQLRLPANIIQRGLNNMDHEDDTVGYLSRWTSRINIWSAHNSRVHMSLKDGTPRLFRQQCLQSLHASQDIYDAARLLASTPDILRSTVSKQEKYEPTRGRCDALLLTPVPVAGYPGATLLKEMYEHSRLIMTQPKGKSEYLAPFAEPPAPVKKDSQASKEKSYPLFDAPLSVPCSFPDAKPISVHKPPQMNAARVSSPHNFILELPQLAIEYKKPHQRHRQTLNQARMYCTASVSYLTAIGIKQYPVFALAAHGSVGSVLMAWMSGEGQHDGIIYIMERNVRQYDISNPLQAFQFATFLLRLKARSDQFVTEFSEKYADRFKESLLDPNPANPIKTWAMRDSAADIQNDAAAASTQGAAEATKSRRSTPSQSTPSLGIVYEAPEPASLAESIEKARAELESSTIGSQRMGRSTGRHSKAKVA